MEEYKIICEYGKQIVLFSWVKIIYNKDINFLKGNI